MRETLFFIKHVLIAYAICIMGIVALYVTEALILDSHIGEAVGVSLTYGVVMYAPMNIVFMLSLQEVDNLFSSLRSKYILFNTNSWCFDWQGEFILTCLFLLVLIFIIKGVLIIWKGTNS